MLLCTRLQPPFTKGLPHQRDKSYITSSFESSHIRWEFFPIEKYKCFLLPTFSICHIRLRWDPFCSPRNDNSKSKRTSVPHSLPDCLTQRNGHRRWGHTRVNAICAEGNCLRTNGWGKMHLMKRRRKFYLFWRAIKDFNKGQYMHCFWSAHKPPYYHYGEIKLYLTVSAFSHRDGWNLSLMALHWKRVITYIPRNTRIMKTAIHSADTSPIFFLEAY